MKHIMPDGRTLMARYDDLRAFFDTHPIVGQRIVDIRPADLFCGRFIIDDWDHTYASETMCHACTDDRICLVFESGDNCEVEFSGEGPILLGYNTADWEQYPVYDGATFSYRTLFQHCLGRTIMAVEFERSEQRMTFPCYFGIDMSEDDEGITTLRFELDDGTCLLMGGWVDWFEIVHSNKYVSMKELLDELTEEVRRDLQG